MFFIIITLLFIGSTACSSREQSEANDMNMAAEPQQSQEGGNKRVEESLDMASTAYQPPNGAEYDAMHFKHYGTNPFITTEEDNQSTFAIDVDTGSYTVVRNYIQRGTLPPEEAVRVEEFINYFKPDIQPSQDKAFNIQVDGGESLFGDGYQLMRVAVKGKEIKVEDRKDANLMFVIDVSGSMDRENRLGLVKKSLRLLMSELGPRDKVGIVVYGSHGKVVLEPTSIDEKEKILSAIDSLHPEGSTNAEEGLTLGYQLAREYFDPEAINRVILCSDGVANVGKTGHEDILNEVKQYAKKDMTLSTFGFGMGNYNDVLMEQLANNGDGNYAYIDTFSEARRIFMEELTGTLQTIAKDAKIQVEFDPAVVERYRLLGYENRDVKDEDFRNDAVDGGEIGAGHTVTALYEVKVKNAGEKLGNIYLRYKNVDTADVEEIHADITYTNSLSDELRFLSAVAEFAEILRGSYWAKEGNLSNVLEVAESTAQDQKQKEFVELVKDANALKKSE